MRITSWAHQGATEELTRSATSGRQGFMLDILKGDGGSNLLDGGAGDDNLSAGGGDDTLIGGAGGQ